MSTEARLERLGLSHLANKPEDLQAELAKRIAEGEERGRKLDEERAKRWAAKQAAKAKGAENAAREAPPQKIRAENIDSEPTAEVEKRQPMSPIRTPARNRTSLRMLLGIWLLCVAGVAICPPWTNERSFKGTVIHRETRWAPIWSSRPIPPAPKGAAEEILAEKYGPPDRPGLPASVDLRLLGVVILAISAAFGALGVFLSVIHPAGTDPGERA